jgi:hypothetical protein
MNSVAKYAANFLHMDKELISAVSVSPRTLISAALSSSKRTNACKRVIEAAKTIVILPDTRVLVTNELTPTEKVLNTGFQKHDK